MNQPIHVIERPRTTETEALERQQYQSDLSERHTGINVAILSISPSFARQYLRKLKYNLRGDCKLAALIPSHEKGYIKINLRNTSGVNSCQPFLHQLVITAKGHGEQLRGAGPNGPEEFRNSVSHLCHNPGCFNPNHIFVEPHIENVQRNSCKGQFIINYKNEFLYDPCTHGRGRIKKKCVLPTKLIETPGYYNLIKEVV